MLISADCVGGECPSEGKRTRKCYKIVDSDFVDVVDILLDREVADYAITVGTFIAVIETYEKRNLPVGRNLMRAVLHYHSLYPYISFEDLFRYNREHSPRFVQYEKDIEKYLCLI